MRRREFIFGSATAAILAPMAHGQSLAVPVVGFISANKPAPSTEAGERVLRGIRQGLAELGYTEGKNYRFEFRNAELHYDRFPTLVQDLVRQQAALIITPFTAGLAAAKSVTQSVPIVFTIGSDPVENGFVTSLNNPGGNITGVFTLNLALAGKRLELLREFIPSVTKFGFITNPASPKFNEPETREIQAAARLLGIDVVVLNAQKPDEFEAAFKSAIQEGAGGIVVGSEALFIIFPAQLVELADRYRIPAIYADDKPAKAGGLVSYGADQDEGFRLVGIYTGHILKGEKPAEMPVQQSTKTRLVINLRTAKAMGIVVPISLLGRADEVIE